MPKMKSKSAAKKRFTLTPSGKIKRSKMGKNHILTKKAPNVNVAFVKAAM